MKLSSTSMPRDIMVSCRSCGGPIKNVVAYLPDVGEVCFECYKKAVLKNEVPAKAKPLRK